MDFLTLGNNSKPLVGWEDLALPLYLEYSWPKTWSVLWILQRNVMLKKVALLTLGRRGF